MAEHRKTDYDGQCHRTAKRCYLSRSSAKNHLKRLRQAEDYQGEIYTCAFCGHWHVGSKLRSPRNHSRE
jgi:hypothetical protein